MPKNKKLALHSGTKTIQILTNDNEVCIPCLSKGQLFSKCPFGRKTSKQPTKYFCISALKLFCSFLGASWKLLRLPGEIENNITNKEAYRKPPKASRKPHGSYQKFQGRNPEMFRLFFGRSFLSKRTF